MSTTPSPVSSRTRLRELYAHIDERAHELAAIHANRLHCGKGCCDCCIDDLSVHTIEADNIRESYSDLLSSGNPHPVGTCAFLDNKQQCRIYDARPYVCRTQGLPLHWIDEHEHGTLIAMRDICALNDPGTPVEQLSEDDCWIIGPVEEELARLQYESSGGRLERSKLRDLFET